MGRMMHVGERGRRACRRWAAGVAAGICCLTAALPLRAAPAGDEAAFMELWQRHLSAGSNPVEFVRASAVFEKQHTGSLLIPPARGLSVWHLLAADQTRVAEQLLEGMEKAALVPGAEAQGEFARRWLTRLDREKVVAALKEYYSHKIEYPPTLDALAALPKTKRPPLFDRWRQAWLYRLDDFKRLQGFTRQRYTLKSHQLGDTSSLAAALARSYPAATGLQVRDYLYQSDNGGTVTLSGPAGPAAVSVGGKAGDWTLVFAGRKVLIFCNGDYWVPQALPGKGDAGGGDAAP